MPNFKSYNELEEYINSKIQQAMELTKNEIFEIVSQKVSDYYSEPVFIHDPKDKPDRYQRTGKFMESLSAQPVTKKANMYEFVVGWDDEYISYRYENQFDPERPGITGESNLHSFNNAYHGWIVKGNHEYWNEAIEEITVRGNVDGIMKKYLKQLGVPVK